MKERTGSKPALGDAADKLRAYSFAMDHGILVVAPPHIALSLPAARNSFCSARALRFGLAARMAAASGDNKSAARIFSSSTARRDGAGPVFQQHPHVGIADRIGTGAAARTGWRGSPAHRHGRGLRPTQAKRLPARLQAHEEIAVLAARQGEWPDRTRAPVMSSSTARRISRLPAPCSMAIGPVGRRISPWPSAAFAWPNRMEPCSTSARV